MQVLPPTRTGVFVLAAGAGWEGAALRALEGAGLAVVKRCVDVADLMGSAATGQGSVALVDEKVPGLDTEAVRHLLAHGVRTVVAAETAVQADRFHRLGVSSVSTPAPEELAEAVSEAATSATDEQETGPGPRLELVDHPGEEATGPEHGRVVAVWGPTGAPGRTTVAIGLAAARAAAGSPGVLVDLDPYGGAVAQHLGVLDEVSGVLATARMANAGTLDEDGFAGSARRVDDRLVVLTGLPRADRSVEVRPGAVDAILELAAAHGDVVADTGFGLADDEPGRGGDRITLETLAAADAVVVVGTAEPTGLARLARGLVDLAERVGPVPVHVVVNRMRPSLGWSERDITGMVEGYARPASTTFLPLDQPAVDRALVAGRSLAEADSPLAQALAGLATTVLGGTGS